MLSATVPIAPTPDFWQQAVRLLLREGQPLGQALRIETRAAAALDFSGVQLMVPAFSHAQNFKAALARELRRPFIAPRINTLSGLLAMQVPGESAPPSESERLMQLYAQLREHGWLKKMFSARRNADLLPLAHTLLALSDELTLALLPEIRASAEGEQAAVGRWAQALAQLLEPLAPSAHGMLSDEAALVWQVWKTQLDANDRIVQRFDAMLALAERASLPLVWVSPTAPEPLDAAFLATYARHQPVRIVTLDWSRQAIAPLHPVYLAAWEELVAGDEGVAPAFLEPASLPDPAPVKTPALSLPLLCPAPDLESAAVQSAQIVLRWLEQGKGEIAIVAQDRVTARRLRALLERAEVAVADETGWKLSTTRAAAALAAWNDLVSARGETNALLDLLKSPFVFPDDPSRADRVMRIEARLRRANIAGDWQALQSAFAQAEDGADLACITLLARQAARFGGRKTLAQWCDTQRALCQALGMENALRDDGAGEQCLLMLDDIAAGQGGLEDSFSFAEWRALLNLRLDATSYMPPIKDRRVVMLPLNGARLRRFDGVLVIGADAAHLPSPPQETLFFSNAVRRELNLVTRAERQRQQLRDLTELLCVNPEVVLCWQTHQDGEPNPVSPWIQRLELKLAQQGMAPLRNVHWQAPLRKLQAQRSSMPAPSAPELLPSSLSASGFGSFLACPYQFFAARMLRVAVMDELSDLPEKRDYGSWLHEILHRYHAHLREQATPLAERPALLAGISEEVFQREMQRHPAALAFHARWQKVMPAYLLWANEREADGWQFVFGEQSQSQALSWQDGGIELYGRLDRVDQNAQGERALLDYKTRSVASLRQKVKEEDDHQLAFYGLLAGGAIEHAHYVALELGSDKKTGDAAAPDFLRKQDMLKQQITTTLHQVAQGAPLPANGIESVCQYCDMRGLCRKGAWL
ncbi:PD-(D/E)XK nuclease family protein [Herbaspirillum sp. BH-1]|uniref:ATP-dependent helicase/nuclease subunit B n=1 Tax=Herbaspirillum frisingense TaxID=92645 RepID=A0ABU1PGU2_9BURK|nr:MULTISPECIES: PD-(D/E)XK nuclease family protein [Herbaspirillum]MDR6585156.1 ATP-dependent helicase/nuclease subunit B [Herbaspirillum frisingense]PLY61013.1 PD-(D/E)XK nuclease family protein [Herbaspirillum sp. BH-1]